MVNPTPIVLDTPHNWSTDYVITHEFSTEIIQSRDGTEQRRALRYTPVKTITMSAIASGDASRRMRAIMNTRLGLNDYLVVPMRRLTVGATVTTSLTVTMNEPRPTWIQVGTLVAFMVEGAPVQVRTVTYAGSTVLERFSIDAALDYPASVGTPVCYVVQGSFGPTATMSFTTANVATPALSFQVNPGSEMSGDDQGVPFPLYKNKEVLTLPEINWATPVNVTFAQELRDVYFNRGLRIRDQLYDFSTRGFQGASLMTHADAETMLLFFQRMYGRLGEFWWSSCQPDFVVTQDIQSGSNTLLVRDFFLYQTYLNHPVYNNIVILLNNGSRIYRKITGMYVEGDDVALVLDANWPTAISTSSIAMVSWLCNSRFASDSLMIEYKSLGVANITLNIQTLPNRD